MKNDNSRSRFQALLASIFDLRPGDPANSRMLAAVVLIHGTVAIVGILLAECFLPSGAIRTTVIIGVSAAILIASAMTLLFLRQRDRIEASHQSELRASEERLKIAMQSVRMGTWDWDIASDKVAWSEEVESIFGLEQGEFAGTFDAYMALLPAEEQRKVQGVINNALDSGGREFHVIHSIHTRDNKTHWLEGRGIIERDANQTPTHIIGTVIDITERIHSDAERAVLLGRMEKRNVHLGTAARVSKFCNSILDPVELIQQAVTLITEGFELYYVGLFLVKEEKAMLQAGYGEAGRRMVEEGYFLPLDERSMIGWSILHGKARIAQRASNDEVRHRNPHLPATRSEMALPLISRERVIGALTFQSIMEDAFNESDIAILQTMSDQIAIAIENARLFSDLQKELEQRKQAEQEREALIRELEAKNAELERFTYTVSHDLKSPLITIRGFLGHLLDDARKGETARMEDDAKRISDATNRMQRLLDELLELSRVGRLVRPPEDIPFEQIVREALSLVEGRIAARNIEVRVEAGMPHVRVDRARLVEALQNLLDNAAKFMGDQPNPLIEIGHVEKEGGQTVFFVRDNGMGIDPKFHAKIFGLFDKLSPSSDGTGVGLALVKRIVEVHGGRIWIESDPGKGATFYFSLPIVKTRQG